MTVSPSSDQLNPDEIGIGEPTPTLQGRVVVIADAGGELSCGITSACVSAGAQVVVIARSETQWTVFQNRLGLEEDDRLDMIMTDPLQEGAVAECRDEILDRYGSIDVVIASIGLWQTAGRRISEVSPDAFQEAQEAVSAHHNLARAFIPVLDGAGRGTYIFTNRHLADFAVELAGPACMACASQRALMESYASEYPAGGTESVRIIEICPQTDNTSYAGTCAEFAEVAFNVGQVAVAAANDPGVHGEIIRL